MELAENFAYYNSVFNTEVKRKENELIPLQALFHFMQLIEVADSAAAVREYFDASLI